MKKMTPLISAFIFSLIAMSPGNFNNNVIKGKINIFHCPEISKIAAGYNDDGTAIMHSDNIMGKANMNIIVIFHPIGFRPKLSPTQDAFITQTEQTFLPHVLPVVVGSKVHFLNEDEFFHNVQSYTQGSRFSIGRRAPGISYSVNIKKTGVIDLMCNIHSHMSAKILSLDTPYFCRVNDDGQYSIGNLPDGKYRIEVFHPTCENVSKEVSIKGGKVFEHDFNISNRP